MPLVLARKAGQKITIGDVVVTVIHVRNGVCRLGIEAPREVRINRHEVQQRIDRESQLKPRRNDAED